MVATRRREQGSAGFTLIELLVVVTIIGVLAGIAVVQVKHAQRKTAENVLKANLALMRKAIDDYYADKQKYPASLQTLVEEKYMRAIPKDPITKNAESWVTVNDEPDPEASESFENYAEPGIIDVKSGAEGETLDTPPIPYGEL
jgi:general secretion pathway protein G